MDLDIAVTLENVGFMEAALKSAMNHGTSEKVVAIPGNNLSLLSEVEQRS
jgi:hypothetical protein